MRSLRILVLLAAALFAAPAFATSFQVTGWDSGETVKVTFNGSARSFLATQFHEIADGVVGTSFRTFPSYPQRFIEALANQPSCEGEITHVEIEPLRIPQQPTTYTEADLLVRHFMRDTSRRVVQKGRFRAA